MRSLSASLTAWICLARVEKICPSMVKLTRTFATTNRQTRSMTPKKNEKKSFVSEIVLHVLYMNLHCMKGGNVSRCISAGERSRDNLYFRLVMGLWMYGNGASRQQFAISNHLGYSG